MQRESEGEREERAGGQMKLETFEKEYRGLRKREQRKGRKERGGE